MKDAYDNEMVVSDDETYRFWIGANVQHHEYIDVTMFFDPADGQRKLQVMGGTAGGIEIHPQSGNVVHLGLRRRK